MGQALWSSIWVSTGLRSRNSWSTKELTKATTPIVSIFWKRRKKSKVKIRESRDFKRKGCYLILLLLQILALCITPVGWKYITHFLPFFNSLCVFFNHSIRFYLYGLCWFGVTGAIKPISLGIWRCYSISVTKSFHKEPQTPTAPFVNINESKFSFQQLPYRRRN